MVYKMIAILARFFIEVISSTKIEMNKCINLYFEVLMLIPKKFTLEKKLQTSEKCDFQKHFYCEIE